MGAFMGFVFFLLINGAMKNQPGIPKVFILVFVCHFLMIFLMMALMAFFIIWIL